MSAIEFIGQGPCPVEISRFYGEGQPVPVFGQRYPGEIADAYRASGLKMGSVVAASSVEVISQQILESASSVAEQGRSYLGPVVGPEGQIVPGIATWVERLGAVGVRLSRAA